MTDVAIIMINYKMKEYIRVALTTLFADIANVPFSVQVVVGDNGSNDGVGEMLAAEFPQVLFLQNGGNRGFGTANNLAMRAVDARYYFLLNPDTRFIEPRTIERLYTFMEEHPRAGLCAPRLLNFDHSLQYSCCRFPSLMVPLYRRTVLGNFSFARPALDHFLMKDWEHNKRRMVDWVIGSAMFMRASALAQIGPMDERFFMYFEDTDWCRRLWDKGWPVYYLADISLFHEHQRASARMSVWRGVFLSKTTRYHIRSWVQYLIKYRRGLTL